nr:MAG TPA: hypothetical protein [Caudoviricetes sp.]
MCYYCPCRQGVRPASAAPGALSLSALAHLVFSVPPDGRSCFYRLVQKEDRW